MPHWSRQQSLSTLAGALPLALAGCQGTASSESLSTGDRRIEEYDVEHVRNGDGEAVCASGDEDQPARLGGTRYRAQPDDLDALPFPDDQYSGLESGTSSSCARPPRSDPFDANVALADGGEGR